MEHLKKGGLHAPNSQTVAETIANGFAPQYILAPRLVGHLACGELAVEPVLGPARVAGVRQSGDTDTAYVHVTWRDEHGPGTATARYPADRSFDVRLPGYEDRLLVRRGIDQAQVVQTGDHRRIYRAAGAAR